MIKFIKICSLTLILFAFTGIPYHAEAKDCSEYDVLSHEWNKCKLNIKKLKKLNPTTETDSLEVANVEKKEGVLDKLKKKLLKKKAESEKSGDSLIESDTVDKINEKCKTLFDCLFKRNKSD